MAKASRAKQPPASDNPTKAGERLTTAAIVTSPQVLAAAGIESWSRAATGDNAELQAVYELLVTKTNKVVHDGSLKSAEAMLYGQAATLQTVFTALVRRAARAEQIPQFQAAMSMALKAQAQCRATLEALAEIKNPRPVAFVKQANIANGPQQVNNGATVSQDGQQAAAMSHAPDNALPIPAGEPVGHPLPATCQAATEPATRAPGGRR